MSNKKMMGEEILATEVGAVEAALAAAEAVVTAAHATYPGIVGEASRAAGGGSLVFKLDGQDHLLRAAIQYCSHYTHYVLSAGGKNVLTAYEHGEDPATLVARVIATAVAGYYKSAPGPVNEDPFLLPEDEIAEFMRRRIEDGELAAEDIPVRLARFGLMDPQQFRAEMAERIALRAEEAAE